MMRFSRRFLGQAAIAAPFAATLPGVVLPRPVWAQERTPEGLNVLTSFAEFDEPLYPEGFEHFDYVNPAAPAGGDIRMPAYGTFERLDTITIGGDWAAGIGLTGDVLMQGSGDELSSYYPSIATQVAFPDDIAYAIFTINEKARWQDGHPITAEDFVFAFDHIKANARPLLKEFWKDIASAEALSEREVRFDFATPDNRKSMGMAAGFSPMPKHYWEASGRDITQSTLEPSLYEGPYRIENVDPGRSITYRRVEDWWAKDLPVNIGTANFETVTYTYFRDVDVMFEAFLGGNFDFWSENSSQRWTTGYDVPDVENGRIVKEVFPQNTPRGFIGFVFNTRRPIFSDPLVREAIGYFFDFQWTRENVFYGNYERAKSYFPGSDYGTADFPLPEGRELELLEPFRDRLPEEIFTEPFTLPVTDGSGRLREQRRIASDLFRQAGWDIRNGRLTNMETGEPFRFTFYLRSDTLLRVVDPFATNLERAGIEMDIRIIDTAQYQRVMDDFDYDMLYLAANFFPPPGPELLTYFASYAADERGSANWAGIKNEVVDALLQEVIAADTLEGKQAATRALDRVLLRNHYIIPSYFNDETWTARWNKLGHPEQMPKYSVGFPSIWWYDEDLARQNGLG